MGKKILINKLLKVRNHNNTCKKECIKTQSITGTITKTVICFCKNLNVKKITLDLT